MARIVAIIPARGGSKTVPRKNLLLLDGHPLIAYSIASAKLSRLVERVVVSTDSPEIAEVARKYGAEVPFLRPAELAQDHSTDMEFFEHFLRFTREAEGFSPEYLVQLRPTSPLRDPQVVERGIQMILDDPTATSLRSAHKVSQTPYKMFRMEGPYLRGFFDHSGLPPEYYNLPRQRFEATYIPNGYVDVVRASQIREGRLHGDRMIGFVTESIPDIDDLGDVEYARRVCGETRFSGLREELRNRHG